MIIGLTLTRSPRVLQRNLALPDGLNPKKHKHWLSNGVRKPWPETIIQKSAQSLCKDFITRCAHLFLVDIALTNSCSIRSEASANRYAAAFVVLMRNAGIPARGRRLPRWKIIRFDGYVVVRQSDAHAWAEVWLENRGWVRDPTAAVSRLIALKPAF